MKTRTLLSALCICACLLSPLARAEEEPRRGRLPDGRAYRTNADGVQIADYIAELELSIEALNRRVEGLESELEEKQRQLERSGRGSFEEPALIERDLIEARRDCPPCEPAGVNARLQAAEREIEMLQADLSAERIRGQSDMRLAQDGVSGCAVQLQELQRRLDVNLREVSAYQNELAALRGALRHQESLLSERNSQIEAQGGRAAQAQAASGEQSRTAPAVVTPALVVARQPVEPARASYARSGGGEKQEFSTERTRAIAAVRAELRSEMNRLQGLIDQRGTRFKQYQSQPRSVQFSLSPLVSSGKSVGAIRQAMEASNDIKELNVLRGEVRRLQSTARDDISLMERLMR